MTSKLRKALGTDQRLAEQLRRSGNHDARVLAMHIADPEAVKPRVIDSWLRDCRDHVLSGELGTLVGRMPSGAEKARTWRSRGGEWPCATGWSATYPKLRRKAAAKRS